MDKLDPQVTSAPAETHAPAEHAGAGTEPSGLAAVAGLVGTQVLQRKLQRRLQRRGAGAEGPPSGGEHAGDKAGPSEHAPSLLRAADAGTRGGGSALPHLDRVQASFGAHDVSGVTAHVGGPAARAADAMGAVAFASGNSVGFREAPDLHTAAHEAAHVVQQRGGVQLKGGVGQEGDAHERHADRVADAVVAGRSAESLLDAYAGSGRDAAGRAPTGPATSGGPTQLQRKSWKERKAEFLALLTEASAALPQGITPQEIADLRQYLEAVTDEKSIDAATHLGWSLFSTKAGRDKERLQKLFDYFKKETAPQENEAQPAPAPAPVADLAQAQAQPQQPPSNAPQAPPPSLVAPQPSSEHVPANDAASVKPPVAEPVAEPVVAANQPAPRPQASGATMAQLLLLDDEQIADLAGDTGVGGRAQAALIGAFEANWFKAKSCLVFAKWWDPLESTCRHASLSIL